MPTGIAIRDVREVLFDAAERILVRQGVGALTSRAVTEEAGCAKGVLHRHFEDFDAFLAALVLDRAARVEARSPALLARAGTGDMVATLTEELVDLYSSVAVAVVPLVIARDPLRARLRAAGQEGLPVLAQAADGITAYLQAEQHLGRLDAQADAPTLALTLIGTGHLMSAGSDERTPRVADVRRVVDGVVGGLVREPRP